MKYIETYSMFESRTPKWSKQAMFHNDPGNKGKKFEKPATLYANSDIEKFTSKNSIDGSLETASDCIDWFNVRASQLRKMHPNSRYTEKIIEILRKLISGEEIKVYYTELETSTAGFQWAKEFADVLIHDGLLKGNKEGNKAYVSLGLTPELNKEIIHKMRGYRSGKNFGI